LGDSFTVEVRKCATPAASDGDSDSEGHRAEAAAADAGASDSDSYVYKDKRHRARRGSSCSSGSASSPSSAAQPGADVKHDLETLASQASDSPTKAQKGGRGGGRKMHAAMCCIFVQHVISEYRKANE